MEFKTEDNQQCFNVSIIDDYECELDEKCDIEMFTCELKTEEGSRVVAVDSIMSVFIEDEDDCGMSMTIYCVHYHSTNDSPQLQLYLCLFFLQRK